MLTVAWNMPGCLPEMEPFTVETPREGWQAIIDTLEADAESLMWEPEDADDPEGPHKRSPVGLMLERWAESDRTGWCYIDGYNYSVEDLS